VQKTTQRKVLRSVLLTKYYWGDQIKNNETGGLVARITERKNARRIFEKSLGTDGSIILN
jgi:hypothetical protein